MLFDVFFFGFPMVIGLCMAQLALREGERKFWTCSFSCFAYLAFYLAGGREVILYLTSGVLLGGAWLSSIPL